MCVCMCVHVCVCVCVYICIHTNVYRYMCIYIYTYKYVLLVVCIILVFSYNIIYDFIFTCFNVNTFRFLAKWLHLWICILRYWKWLASVLLKDSH